MYTIIIEEEIEQDVVHKMIVVTLIQTHHLDIDTARMIAHNGLIIITIIIIIITEAKIPMQRKTRTTISLLNHHQHE